ncbi:transmembrane protein 92-like [Mastomys coucha]|uniref:transmembrane protein 92-like n=1 Tax=Mastomys coucha TaxID=35658 RepID=UPI001261E4B8|nr:transmembrane protein 92-like [Mastomys coucha]
MQDAWVQGALILIFGLLSSIQQVSTNEAINTCGILNCTKGFRCCDNECCPERKVWNPANKPFRIVFINVCIILPLLCICGLLRHFCPNQVVLKPTPTEPPPPYSFRPKGPASQMRRTGYATLSATPYTNLLDHAQDPEMTAYPIVSLVL